MKKSIRLRARAFAPALSVLAFVSVNSAQSKQLSNYGEKTITATRFAESADELPFGVSVITAQQIKDSGALTVNEAIMRLLGVQGRQDLNGGGEYMLDLRGFGTTSDSNQVIVVDGVRLSEADTGGTRLAGISIDSVERIEVVRGSGAVLYGEGATGGVIVVTTKAGIGRQTQNDGSVYVGYGSQGLHEVRANANLVKDGFSLEGFAQNRDADNYRDNARSKSDAAALTAQWTTASMRFGGRVVQDRLNARLPGDLTAAQYASNPRQSTKPNDSVAIENQRNSLFAEMDAGPWKIAADAGWRTKSVRSMNSGYAYDYDTEAANHGVRARHEGTLGAHKNIFVTGHDYNNWSRTVLGAYGSQADQTSRAWYVKDDLILANTGTRLSAGWRTESFNKSIDSAPASVDSRQRAWDLGASQRLDAQWTAYARTGQSFRLPNVDEFSFVVGSGTLKPQTSRDQEFGLRRVYESGRYEVRAYRSELTNEIGFDPNIPNPAFWNPANLGANVNFDPTRRQGLELDADHKLSASVKLRGNLAWRTAHFREGTYAGKQVPLVPEKVLALGADWQLAPAHKISGGMNWISSSHPDVMNQCVMPSYSVANVRYAYQLKEMDWALAVNNLTDRRYFTQAFGCSNQVTSSIYPEPGRALMASMRYRF
jgi:iron complex outermembrane recepter protein